MSKLLQSQIDVKSKMGEIDKLQATIAELNMQVCRMQESENVLTAKLSQMQNGTNVEVEESNRLKSWIEQLEDKLKKYRSMKNRYGDHGSYAVECQRIMEAAEADV